jgi:hypothetical protein
MRREPYDRRLAQREEHFQERAHSVSRTDGRRRERAQPSTCQAAKADAAGGWEAQSKVRALAALVGLGPASPLAEAELRRLLEDVASDPPGRRSWCPGAARGAQGTRAARGAAGRRGGAKVRRLFDDRRDHERVAPDGWFPEPNPPGWVALFAHDTLGAATVVSEPRQRSPDREGPMRAGHVHLVQCPGLGLGCSPLYGSR